MFEFTTTPRRSIVHRFPNIEFLMNEFSPITELLPIFTASYQRAIIQLNIFTVDRVLLNFIFIVNYAIRSAIFQNNPPVSAFQNLLYK